MRWTDPTGLDRYKACENPDLSWLGKKLCKKGVDWRCRSTPGEGELCCYADRLTCEEEVKKKRPETCQEEGLMKECQDKFRECMWKTGKDKVSPE